MPPAKFATVKPPLAAVLWTMPPTKMPSLPAEIVPAFLIPPAKEVTVVPPGSLARPPTKIPCEPAVIVPLLAIPPPAVPLANTPTEELTTMPSPVDAASWPLLVMPPEKVETWRMWMSS
jgi:hypothetical protein